MFYYLTIAAAILTVCNSQETNYTLVNVDLYYAALCSDARNFVLNQLVPTHEEIGDYLNVTYIPYGKATQEYITDGNGTGQWNFTCQHGDEGCYGNRAQACAIDEILTNSEITNEQQLLVDFIGCCMAASNRSRATPECLETIGVDAEYISSVNECINSTEGDELKAAYGDITAALVPTLTFVPTIVINGVFTQENQDNALEEFQNLVCENIPEDSRPSACNSSTSLHGQKTIFAIAILSLCSSILGKGYSHQLL